MGLATVLSLSSCTVDDELKGRESDGPMSRIYDLWQKDGDDGD